MHIQVRLLSQIISTSYAGVGRLSSDIGHCRWSFSRHCRLFGHSALQDVCMCLQGRELWRFYCKIFASMSRPAGKRRRKCLGLCAFACFIFFACGQSANAALEASSFLRALLSERLVGVSMKGTHLSLAGAGRCGDLDLNALDVDQQQLLLEVLNHSSCQKVGVDLAPTIQVLSRLGDLDLSSWADLSEMLWAEGVTLQRLSLPELRAWLRSERQTPASECRALWPVVKGVIALCRGVA
ncbi:unnamed protein product [Effrenium voratum]|nr:unnamed protein product [Effrenium voratum]